MHTTLERPAPANPENHDGKLFQNDGSPEEPDEIIYTDGPSTWVTTREERARANKIWQQEGQVPYPDNAAANLERTERMLRFHLKHMGETEDLGLNAEQTAPAQTAQENWQDASTGNFNEAIPHHSEQDWVNEPTGEFVIPNETAAQQAVTETEYVGRHRERTNKRRMRMPLHRLIRHGSALYRARHAAK